MTDDAFRAQDVGQGLATALIRHAMTTAKDTGLDPTDVIEAAADELAAQVRRTHRDWQAWAAEHDVRGDDELRQN